MSNQLVAQRLGFASGQAFRQLSALSFASHIQSPASQNSREDENNKQTIVTSCNPWQYGIPIRKSARGNANSIQVNGSRNVATLPSFHSELSAKAQSYSASFFRTLSSSASLYAGSNASHGLEHEHGHGHGHDQAPAHSPKKKYPPIDMMWASTMPLVLASIFLGYAFENGISLDYWPQIAFVPATAKWLPLFLSFTGWWILFLPVEFSTRFLLPLTIMFQTKWGMDQLANYFLARNVLEWSRIIYAVGDQGVIEFLTYTYWIQIANVKLSGMLPQPVYRTNKYPLGQRQDEH